MSQAAPYASDNYRASARLGYALIVCSVGIFGAWAYLAQVDSAVVAGGQVVVDGRRQVIQHLEGGIVSRIAVKEGQTVEEGAPLIDLDETEAGANVDILRSQLDFALAEEVRLRAQVAGERELHFPPELTSRSEDPRVAKTLAEARNQFNERNQSLDSQTALLQSRDGMLRNQIEGLLVERASNESQLKFLEEELVGVRMLEKKGLVPKQRLLALEREKARIEGDIGRNAANEAVANDNLRDVALQIRQLRDRAQEEDFAALNDIRQKLEDLPNRVKVMTDRVQRTRIVAPRSGVVQNLRVSTIGQVVRPGDLLLEIVPRDAHLIIDANVPVVEVDSVSTGMKAEVRFPAFHQRDTPVMFGNVMTVSRDRLVDEETRQPYFLARIEINKADIPDAIRSRLQAGMPAEVIVARGERSVLNYLVKPLEDAFRRTFREE